LTKVQVVGQYSHDALYESYAKRTPLRREISATYFPESGGNNLLILALPQLFEHNIQNFDLAMQEIDYLVKTLSEIENLNILISLHPKMRPENYAFVKHYKGVNISRKRLYDILPSADLYISAFESTITWSLMCGVISIYIDFYKLGLDLSKYNGCIVLAERDNFGRDVNLLCESISPQEYSEDEIPQQARGLPPFDGHSGDRILLALQELVDE